MLLVMMSHQVLQVSLIIQQLLVLRQHLLAATNSAGTKVILTYDEALSATTAATSAFAVTWWFQ